MACTRRKITLAGSNPAALALLVEADLADVVVLDCDPEGLPGVRAGGWVDAAGSDVVVGFGDAPDSEELLLHCPGAVVVVGAADPAPACRALLEATHLPRGRVLGVTAPGPATLGREVVAIVAAVLLDRRSTHEAVVLCDGERGEAGMVQVPVCVGGAGVESILPA